MDSLCFWSLCAYTRICSTVIECIACFVLHMIRIALSCRFGLSPLWLPGKAAVRPSTPLASLKLFSVLMHVMQPQCSSEKWHSTSIPKTGNVRLFSPSCRAAHPLLALFMKYSFVKECWRRWGESFCRPVSRLLTQLWTYVEFFITHFSLSVDARSRNGSAYSSISGFSEWSVSSMSLVPQPPHKFLKYQPVKTKDRENKGAHRTVPIDVTFLKVGRVDSGRDSR